jgi:uncharacterized protein YcbX
MLQEVDLTERGIAGDRIVHVEDRQGRVTTARTKHRLLGLHATLDADGEPVIDGRSWRSPEAAAAVRAAVGSDATLVGSDGVERFDVLPLLIATDGAIAALGVDHRRLRPNIVVANVDGLAERQWPGRRLAIGDAIIAVAKLRARCVMTTFDPNTLEQNLSVLRRIVSDFDGTMALDCAVVRGGRLAVGMSVTLLD